MIKQVIILLFCYLASNNIHLHASDALVKTSELIYLYELAGRSLNFSSTIPEDSLIRLAIDLETQARGAANDYDNYFKIGQIKVNAYCLKGDIGVAINEAKDLYENAKNMNNPVGTIMALQAIGDTYMHSGQPQQALAAFMEAEKQFGKEKKDNNLIRIRLYTQIVHVCWALNDWAKMHLYLGKLSDLLPHSAIESKEHYEFYLLCYKTLYFIGVKKMGDASLLLKQVCDQSNVAEPFYKRWYYWIAAYYWSLENNYEKALAFADSTLVETKQSGNLNEYRNAMFEKASLFEKMHEEAKACEIYKEMDLLTDSLNIQRYTRQIEHLHTAYLVDQLEVENKEVHSALLTWIIISCSVILLGGIIVFLMVRHKNKMLILSRNKLQVIREETTQSIQSKSMFLSNMSHELRTPLNAIVGFSGILMSGSEIDEETKKQCGDTIKQNADLLLKLIKDVMDFSEFNINEIRYTCDTYNAVNICRTVLDTVDKVKQTSATMGFVTSLEELNLYTDNGRLQQILINILINATKFTKEGTITLRLDVDRRNNEAVFTVEDTGCGIPLEKQPHIFERFEKLHEGIQGSGLGLSICQLIVEHFGGKIWIDSSYKEGARFIFTHPLPLTDSASL